MSLDDYADDGIMIAVGHFARKIGRPAACEPLAHACELSEPKPVRLLLWNAVNLERARNA
jgi:hypothetical protein